MSDYSYLNEAKAQEVHFDRMLSRYRFVMPGNVLSFKSDPPRVTIQPSLKMKSVQNGKASYIDLPVLLNVPICIPFGFSNNVVLTFGISTGDPCLVLFSDRAMDNFVREGKNVAPDNLLNNEITSVRQHDLSDAIALIGLITDAHPIPDWQNDAIEMRSIDRNYFVSLKPNKEIRLKTPNAEVLLLSDTITLSAFNTNITISSSGLNMKTGGTVISSTQTRIDLTASGGVFANGAKIGY